VRTFRLLISMTLVTLAVSLPAPASVAQDLGGCRSIIHHGMNPNWGEESIYSTGQASKWGFGGEVDARITVDKKLGPGHDRTARRVSGGTEKRRWSDMTLSEIKAIHLSLGGRPASVAEMIRAAKRSGGKLMVTINGYHEFGDDWRAWGFIKLRQIIVASDMRSRVLVGGFGMMTYLHENFPGIRTFRRLVNNANPSPARLTGLGIDLVALPRTAYRRSYVEALRAAGLTVATRQIYTKHTWRAAYDAGIRLFQVNWDGSTAMSPANIAKWCRARR